MKILPAFVAVHSVSLVDNIGEHITGLTLTPKGWTYTTSTDVPLPRFRIKSAWGVFEMELDTALLKGQTVTFPHTLTLSAEILP